LLFDLFQNGLTLSFVVVEAVWVDGVLHFHVHQHQKSALSFLELILQL